MNFLDKFRYSFDNLNEIENLKNEDKEKKNIYNNPFLKSLLSNSVNDIVFDEYGYVYIATSIGISIFETISTPKSFNALKVASLTSD